ncbi:MAG: cytochrome P460 family protein [Thiogranum sp.]
MINLIRNALICLTACSGTAFAETEVLAAPNGITLPQGYKNWAVIGSSHREDNKTLRVILGNDVAIKAARAGETKPWPDGSILGKLVWKDAVHQKWEKATVPGEFVHAEFMFKDSNQYRDTGGWGFARWKGLDQKPYGADASFVQECFSCHTPVKDNDYVFTHPSPMP